MRKILAPCGCEVPAAKKYEGKEKFKCSVCGRFNCGDHTYSYVDGNNISITKNSPNICVNCKELEKNV